MKLTPLPVDALMPRIIASLRTHRNLVIEAAPGAGKTTRVPPALDDAGLGPVLVLEPRRIAARMAARRVAAERGEDVGGFAGYQVRFEQFAGPDTRVRFLTEGVLTRRLLADPELRDAGVVVLDEFHERHLETDLALALLLRLQKTTRSGLRLVIMSATADSRLVSQHLGGCPTLVSEGRLFPLDIKYQPESRDTLEEKVANGVAEALEGEGDILVFLPGAAEIRRSMESCAGLAQRANLLLLPLHGDLPAAEQDRAVSPAGRRKVIFSTNVAESSITVEGVSAVVDSGLARVASDSLWSGLPVVEVRRISRASATQRAGRAGRTGPGRVIRLYTAEDFYRRPEFDSPEILRRELAQLCLDLHAAGVLDPEELVWLNPPPEQALGAAEDLLRRLGALDQRGGITQAGRRMARLPLHPRLSALATLGGAAGCAAAAILSAGDRLAVKPDHPAPSDIQLLVEQPRNHRTRQLEQQIRRIARPPDNSAQDEELLRKALLRAFPDRVARRRKSDLALSNGDSARLASSSAVTGAEFLVALDVEHRPDQGGALVRLASSIEVEWLLEWFPEQVRETAETRWNPETQRAERLSTLWYDKLLIDESRRAASPEESAALLADQAVREGLGTLLDNEAWSRLTSRLAFAAEQGDLPPLEDTHIAGALAELAAGLQSFSQLRHAMAGGQTEAAILRRLGPNAARILNEVAPEKIRLPGGRLARIEYPLHQAPSVASRLQDFFGLRETPRVARGRVALVVHLLAPSQRPVQTTTDLAGFWERLYPRLRRELSRRYPKHAWPENPYTAERK